MNKAFRTTDWRGALKRDAPVEVDVYSLDESDLRQFRKALKARLPEITHGTGVTAYTGSIRPSQAKSQLELELALALDFVERRLASIERQDLPTAWGIQEALDWARGVFVREGLPAPGAQVFWSRHESKWKELPERFKSLQERSWNRMYDGYAFRILRKHPGYRFLSMLPTMRHVVEAQFEEQSEVWYANEIIAHYDSLLNSNYEILTSAPKSEDDIPYEEIDDTSIRRLTEDAFRIGELFRDAFWKFDGPEEYILRNVRKANENRLNAHKGGAVANETARKRREAFSNAALEVVKRQQSAWNLASDKQRVRMVRRHLELQNLECFSAGAKPVGTVWYEKMLSEVIADGSLAARLEKPDGY